MGVEPSVVASLASTFGTTQLRKSSQVGSAAQPTRKAVQGKDHRIQRGIGNVPISRVPTHRTLRPSVVKKGERDSSWLLAYLRP
jgi:hypothetical protein